MRLNFVVTIPDLKDIESATIEDYKKVLYLSMSKMENLAKKRCPVDFGLLRASINLNPRSFGAKEYTLSDGVKYGYLVEYGTSTMIRAHGEHDPENPVTDWEAKRKRNGFGQTLPFFRPALLEVNKIWVNKFWEQTINSKKKNV
jgi:hypothetical protein